MLVRLVGRLDPLSVRVSIPDELSTVNDTTQEVAEPVQVAHHPLHLFHGIFGRLDNA